MRMVFLEGVATLAANASNESQADSKQLIKKIGHETYGSIE